MKPFNAKTVRILLVLTYLGLAFLVLSVCGWLGWRVHIRIDTFRTDARRTSAVLQSCREALEDAASAFSDGSGESSATLRKSRELIRNAEILERNLYGTESELHPFARDFISSVRTADAALGKANTPDRMRQSRAMLAQAERSLRLLEQAESEAGLAAVGRIHDVFFQLAGILLCFFAISLAFMVFGFSLIGSNLRRSLRTLCEGTRFLRAGHLNFRFREIAPDEVGEVKYDINIMARRLELQSNELKTANGELRDQAEKLIAAHQHKDRFLSNMSHELRTPLNSIIGFSELLEQRAGKLGPDRVRSHAKRILTAADHLLELITSLLDLAKSGAGTLKPVYTEFDLSSALAETIAMLTPLADKKGLRLETMPEPGIVVEADRRMILQIFINLFSNAVKYTREGFVRVELRRDAARDEAVLDVSDSGIGIPEAEQPALFTDFHRVDNGPEMVVDGVGIGLALSRRLAALHSADLSFVSRYGKGSTFTLRLPVRRRAEMRQPRPDREAKEL